MDLNKVKIIHNNVTICIFSHSAVISRDHPDLWKFNGHLFEFLCSNSAIDKIEFTENLNAEITFYQ